MESASSLPPSSKRAKFADNPIDKLPDSLLAKIFAYLPCKDRYLLCLVSSKWAAASRIPWTDICFLNLNSLPRAMVNPILWLCPKVEKIEANAGTIMLAQHSNAILSVNENVKTIRLRKTDFAVIEPDGRIPPGFIEKYSELIRQHLGRFPNVAELHLQNVAGGVFVKDIRTGRLNRADRIPLALLMPETVAVSLRRLVLIDAWLFHGIPTIVGERRTRLPNLECLYLDHVLCVQNYTAWDLPQLRELCVHSRDEFCRSENSSFNNFLAGGVAGGQFPKLEVFMYSAADNVSLEGLALLITSDLPLRILAVAGRDDKLQRAVREAQELGQSVGGPNGCLLTVPPRGRSSSGSILEGGSRKKPCLQIFVGGDITKHLRFTLPPSDVANFWRIDCPMPEYLAKPEVAAVFKNVFVAKIIREGPENGLKPWGHPNDMEWFYSTSPLLFR